MDNKIATLYEAARIIEQYQDLVTTARAGRAIKVMKEISDTLKTIQTAQKNEEANG